MQFVNIIVHSVEDMNFRVHLQYEFTALGLDNYLEKLRFTESEELQVQISAYLDNVFDVAALMEDSETKTAALEKVGELEDELAQVGRQRSGVEGDRIVCCRCTNASKTWSTRPWRRSPSSKPSWSSCGKNETSWPNSSATPTKK